MATDKEVAFPVENFVGVDRQVDREDRTPNHLHNLQNLWEKEIGILETRPGSANFIQKPFPSNIIGLDNVHKIYKPNEETIRVQAIHCNQDVGPAGSDLTTLPANVSVAFTSGGNFGAVGFHSHGGGTIDTFPANMYVRFIGYGVDKMTKLQTSSISGWSFSAAAGDLSRLKFDVTISSAMEENVTHMEIYASILVGSSASDAMWIGTVDLKANPTGTFSFKHCPATRGGGITDGTSFQAGITSFDLVETDSGPFKKGQTVFVEVLADYKVFDVDADSEALWRNSPLVTPGSANNIPQSITFKSDNAGLNIDNISPARFAVCVFIGDTPQTMRAVMVKSILSSPAVTDVLVNNTTLADGHPHSFTGAAVIDWEPLDTNQNNYRFKGSRFSTKDMLIKVADDGSISPIFIDRMASGINSEEGDFNVSITEPPGFGSTTSQHWLEHLFAMYMGGVGVGFQGSIVNVPQAGDGSSWRFVQARNAQASQLLMVNDFDVTAANAQPAGTPEYPHAKIRDGANYFITDGNVAAAVIWISKTERQFISA